MKLRRLGISSQNINKKINLNGQNTQLFEIILQQMKILTAKKSDPKIDTTTLEKEINQLIYQLYNLTYEETKIIDPEFELTKQEYQAITIQPNP